MTTDRLTARAAIVDVLHRYARGVDRRDWTLVRECYHDDATDEHGPFVGGCDDFVEWLRGLHADIEFSAHLVSNVSFLTESVDVVDVETYATTRQITRAGGASVFAGANDASVHTVGYCRYLDRFERRAGCWAIAHRRVVFDAMTMLEGVTRVPVAMEWIHGTRDGADPSYRSHE